MKKFSVPVSTYVRVNKFVKNIECDSFEEYDTIMTRDYHELLEEGYISHNITNDFEVDGDTEVDIIEPEDFKFYENKQ